MQLTMRPNMQPVRNGVLGPYFLYDVSLPAGNEAQIVQHCNRETGWKKCWQFRVIVGGKCGEWVGQFDSPEDALARLQRAIVN